MKKIKMLTFFTFLCLSLTAPASAFTIYNVTGTFYEVTDNPGVLAESIFAGAEYSMQFTYSNEPGYYSIYSEPNFEVVSYHLPMSLTIGNFEYHSEYYDIQRFDGGYRMGLFGAPNYPNIPDGNIFCEGYFNFDADPFYPSDISNLPNTLNFGLLDQAGLSLELYCPDPRNCWGYTKAHASINSIVDPVPEPSMMILFSIGIIGMIACRKFSKAM